MVLYLFLAMLYQAFLRMFQAAFLTHVLYLEGSHHGVLYEEIIMTVINYIVKKPLYVLVNSVKHN